MRRLLRVVLGVILVVLVIGAGALVFFTSTDAGRERVRRFALDAMRGPIHGIVRMGRVSGNLLRGITIESVSITDSSGVPFLVADSITTRYGLGGLLKKRLDLAGLRLIRPVVIIDKPPGGTWNYKRIFPGDTTAKDTTKLGWGHWVVFHDMTVVDGRVVVRRPWSPKDSLSPAQRDSIIALALSGGTRVEVRRVPGGFQQTNEFRSLDATIPLFRLAHPDYHERQLDVASMKSIVAIFRPPYADVRDLAGRFLFNNDSIWWARASVRLPGSQIAGPGKYVFAGGDMGLQLHGEPVAIADLRWLYPRLPSGGGGSLDFALAWRADTSTYIARNADVRVERAHLAGNFGLTLTDTFALHDTQLRFANVDTRLIEQLVPSLRIPRRGTLDGRTAIAGGRSALRLDGDVTFTDAGTGPSRVIAVGEVGFPKSGGIRARDLRLRAAPIQVALARIAMPTLPIAGTLSGRATVNGSTATRLAAVADLVHEEAGARSHLTGRAQVQLAGRRWLDLDLRAAPLALATVGKFAPAIGLRSTATGPIRVRGPFDDLALQASLRFPDGGGLSADGHFDIASQEKGYDLAMQAELFDANLVVEKAPRTSLTATASARGRGFDPATMRSALAADLDVSSYDSVAVDTASVRVTIAGGVATVDTLFTHGAIGRADAAGTFGLVAGRNGALTFRMAIDSLSPLNRWLPVDTGVVAPRPMLVRRAMERARADSARIAEATEVERMATGAVSKAPRLVVDTPRVVRRDSLAGRAYAVGTLGGNVTHFELRGRAAGEGLVLLGNTIRRMRAEFGVFHGHTSSPRIAVAVQADTVTAAGFAFDSLDARLIYRSPNGTAQVLVRQGEKRDYVAKADFVLHTDSNEVRLTDMAFRFDTTRWVGVRPSVVRWGNRGVEVDSLELRNGGFGRIFVDGRLPTQGSASLLVAVDNFEIANLLDLLQSDIDAHGVISLSAGLEGTTRDPRFRGAAGLVQGVYNGTTLPELHTTFNYAGARLAARAEALRGGGAPLLVAQADLPINLAFSGVVGPRLRNRRMTADVVLDSLPLDLIPQFTDAVAQMRGSAVGSIALRGRLRRPHLAGAVAVNEAAFRVVPTGMQLQHVAGLVRMQGDSVVIDSLVGWSGGRVRLSGGIGVADLTKPSFDLHLYAVDARVLDNEQGRIRADASIDLTGPFAQPQAKGLIAVRSGVIYLPESRDKQVIGAGDPAVFNVVDTSVVSDRELLPGQSPFLKNLRMDVGVQIGRDLWVRSHEANVEVYGDLAVHVDRSASALTLEGSLNSDRGEYTFLTKRFQIRRGAAIFIGSPELNPTLQLTGEYPVRLPGREALNIRVLIGGTLQRPRLTLESDAQPPIPQSDLLSYLAFGRSSSSLLQLEGSGLSGPTTGGTLVGTGASLATRRLAAVAVGVLADEVEGEATRSLGMDVFNITPADVPTEISRNGVGDFLRGTELEVGKYTDAQTFVAIQARPDIVAPGVRAQRRMPKGLRLEGSWEPRYLLRQPSLESDTKNPAKTQVFGLFVIREWRF
jgi:translocation and assembly module TamB